MRRLINVQYVAPLETFTTDMEANLPKQENPGATDSRMKPEAMDPSFFEALLSKGIPHGLVEYMSSENVNSLEERRTRSKSCSSRSMPRLVGSASSWFLCRGFVSRARLLWTLGPRGRQRE